MLLRGQGKTGKNHSFWTTYSNLYLTEDGSGDACYFLKEEILSKSRKKTSSWFFALNFITKNFFLSFTTKINKNKLGHILLRSCMFKDISMDCIPQRQPLVSIKHQLLFSAQILLKKIKSSKKIELSHNDCPFKRSKLFCLFKKYIRKPTEISNKYGHSIIAAGRHMGLEPNLLLKMGLAARSDQAAQDFYTIRSWKHPRMETAPCLWAAHFTACDKSYSLKDSKGCWCKNQIYTCRHYVLSIQEKSYSKSLPKYLNLTGLRNTTTSRLKFPRQII